MGSYIWTVFGGRLECFRILKYDVEAECLSKQGPGPEKGQSRTRELESQDLLEQLPALQQLLYRLVGCRPEGAANNNYLVQYALALLRRIKQFTMEACMALTLSVAVLTTLAAISAATTTGFTLHNLCPYPVWPLVSPNAGLPDIATDAALRLESNGLATLTFPSGAWSGCVVPRTGCSDVATSANCATGSAPPCTVAQVSVNGPGGLAAYSVSLADGFNVPATVTPHGFEQGLQCPALGCAVDLNAECPVDAKVGAGGCRAQPQLFKQMCPDARTTPTDVEATPQHCVDPAELKVVFCPTS